MKAQNASPLHDLTEKGASFLWTEHCQQAFDTLKKALTEAPMNTNEPTGRLARYALFLQQHDLITHTYRSGLINVSADALSRLPHESVVAAHNKPGAQIDRVGDAQRRDFQSKFPVVGK